VGHYYCIDFWLGVVNDSNRIIVGEGANNCFSHVRRNYDLLAVVRFYPKQILSACFHSHLSQLAIQILTVVTKTFSKPLNDIMM
jgi:hypothetical protein